MSDNEWYVEINHNSDTKYERWIVIMPDGRKDLAFYSQQDAEMYALQQNQKALLERVVELLENKFK